ncbi:unnamed protein product [Caenorhabditis sp. 36 PRJEB53466]|nr:unnamed protein product [Caenorhabditis sp. 36 PRJEB53466]
MGVDRLRNWWNGEKTSSGGENSWKIPQSVYSGASAVGSFLSSAVSSVGNLAKYAYNSEIVASGTSTVKSYAGSAAKNLWSSEKPQKTEVSRKSEKKAEKPVEEPAGDGYRGAIVAMSRNASRYVVQTVGRSSNIVNIFDKSQISALGNPKWWIRFDRPHRNVDFHHINVNKAITGVRDPHIPISATTAKAAGIAGKMAEKANEIAPILTTAALVYEMFRVGKEVKKDYDHGTTRNTVKSVTATSGAYASGTLGACAGATIGTSVIPGLGTIFGGIVGGVVGAYYGGHASHVASEMLLDHVGWDTVRLECVGCKEELSISSWKWRRPGRRQMETENSLAQTPGYLIMLLPDSSVVLSNHFFSSLLLYTPFILHFLSL